MILHIFFFNDTATTEIYTLSLHDALPIFLSLNVISTISIFAPCWRFYRLQYKDNNVPFHLYYIQQEQYFHNQYHRLFLLFLDRKSTRLNSSHANISYAVFCLKKKNRFNQL